MLEFVARVFRGFMNVLLWLILIGFVVGGFIFAGSSLGGRGFSVGYAFLGLIIGGLIGLITTIISGGLIANFLNMVDNIESIKYQLSKSGNSSSGNSTVNDINPAQIAKPVYGNTWTCKKCSEVNLAASSSCKGCGEYR